VHEALEFDTRRVGGGIVAASWLLALFWIGGAAAFAYLFVGEAALTAMAPAMQGGLAIIALLPAFLILFAGAAAREGARARAQAHVLSAAAEKMLNPSPAAEAAARRMGVSVRGEIAALERAIDQAMVKAREVEAIISRQTEAMDQAANGAQHGAQQILSGMERERQALMQIAHDLNGQAAMVGDSISRHSHVIGQAVLQAEQEIRAADDVLDTRLSSFSAAAALISDRTSSLSRAAQASADSAQRLESVLGGALDALTKATSLTDAARQSAEDATFAANNTAGAVRETTMRAVEDARRAAEFIRGEAASVERDAASAMDRLKQAADAAREAASGVRHAAAHVSADLPRTPPQPLRPVIEPPRELPREAPREKLREPSRPAADKFGERMAGIAPSRPAVTVSPPPPNEGAGKPWTWREVLAAIEEQPPRGTGATEPPRRQSVRAAESGGVAQDMRSRHPLAVVDLVDGAGVHLAEVFDINTLDRIAQRARNGTQARRRAVRDAAPQAVERLADHLGRDQHARAAANEFLRSEGNRVSELLGRGRASMSADATRAFLLIDAAAS
ncbi:MAG: hypothetical protein ABUS57_22355, partial [Pseudomonadota bacterium]